MDIKHFQNELKHVSNNLRDVINLFRPGMLPNHSLTQKFNLVNQKIREYEQAIHHHALGHKGINLHHKKSEVQAALNGFEHALGLCEIKFKDSHHRIHKLRHSIH